MADKPSPTAKASTIRCRVVDRYGKHQIGSTIEVTESEYNRLRKPIEEGPFAGRHRYPVLVTDAHAREEAQMDRDLRDAEDKARKRAVDAADSAAWAEMQQQAREELDRRGIEQQERQKQKVIGSSQAAG